jgi:hypothetical protein
VRRDLIQRYPRRETCHTPCDKDVAPSPVSLASCLPGSASLAPAPGRSRGRTLTGHAPMPARVPAVGDLLASRYTRVAFSSLSQMSINGIPGLRSSSRAYLRTRRCTSAALRIMLGRSGSASRSRSRISSVLRAAPSTTYLRTRARADARRREPGSAHIDAPGNHRGEKSRRKFATFDTPVAVMLVKVCNLLAPRERPRAVGPARVKGVDRPSRGVRVDREARLGVIQPLRPGPGIRAERPPDARNNGQMLGRTAPGASCARSCKQSRPPRGLFALCGTARAHTRDTPAHTEPTGLPTCAPAAPRHRATTHTCIASASSPRGGRPGAPGSIRGIDPP